MYEEQIPNSWTHLTARHFYRALDALPDYPKKSVDMQFCTEVICRVMDKAEYQKLKDEIMADAKRKIEALDIVWRLSNKNEDVKQPSTADMIREALPQFDGKPFTVVEMKEAIETLHPEMNGRIRLTSISGTFTRMAARGDAIRLAREGSGPRGALYASLSVQKH